MCSYYNASLYAGVYSTQYKPKVWILFLYFSGKVGPNFWLNEYNLICQSGVIGSQLHFLWSASISWKNDRCFEICLFYFHVSFQIIASFMMHHLFRCKLPSSLHLFTIQNFIHFFLFKFIKKDEAFIVFERTVFLLGGGFSINIQVHHYYHHHHHYCPLTYFHPLVAASFNSEIFSKFGRMITSGTVGGARCIQTAQ